MAEKYWRAEELKVANVSVSSQQAFKLRFSRKKRLLTSNDYQQILRTGQSHKGREYSVWVKPNALEKARLGIIISKKQISSVVKRNKIKRQIRERFRVKQALFTHLDVIFMVYKGILTLNPDEFETQMGKTWQKILATHKK